MAPNTPFSLKKALLILYVCLLLSFPGYVFIRGLILVFDVNLPIMPWEGDPVPETSLLHRHLETTYAERIESAGLVSIRFNEAADGDLGDPGYGGEIRYQSDNGIRTIQFNLSDASGFNAPSPGEAGNRGARFKLFDVDYFLLKADGSQLTAIRIKLDPESRSTGNFYERASVLLPGAIEFALAEIEREKALEAKWGI